VEKKIKIEKRGLGMVEVGEEAPDFCLPNQDVEEICLRDFEGSWLILYFYPKDNTPGCTTEALDFSSKIYEFEALGATVIGVSPDSVKRHQNFIAKKGVKITLLSDEDKRVCSLYGVWQLKKSYGKEYMGVVRSTFLINPEGKIVHKWERVRVKGHVDKILKRLKELLS
jgi:peroxiredoxin Q/BCP